MWVIHSGLTGFTLRDNFSGATMAKPNYQFEKRQRELKKIKQQEEKRLKKLAGGSAAESADADDSTEPTTPDTTTPEQTP